MTDLSAQAAQLDDSVRALTRAVEDLSRRTRTNRAVMVVLVMVVAAVVVLGVQSWRATNADQAEDCASALESRTEQEQLLVGLAAERPQLVEAVHDYYDGLPEPGACT